MIMKDHAFRCTGRPMATPATRWWHHSLAYLVFFIILAGESLADMVVLFLEGLA